MLREEQIDLRRRRAKESRFLIQNLGRNRVFSDYQVTNPSSRGSYKVAIRGFETGDNTCECPDFRSNTLGTCKHIEAVLESLRDDAPANVRHRKAAVTRPEIYLHYGEQLRLGIHLPPRGSDPLRLLGQRFFDSHGFWSHAAPFSDLIPAVRDVPEAITIYDDALEYIDREILRSRMQQREAEMMAQLAAGELPTETMLKIPLYDYQMQGAIFLACRGRSILGDDMGLGKTVQTMAAVEILAKECGIERVLVVAPASVKYQWETEIRRFTERPVQIIEGGHEDRLRQYSQPTFYRLVNYEQVLRDLDALNAWQADVVVLDEAQRIKNWASKVSRAVKKLRSRQAMVLTGTPLENRIEELYSIVQFVDDRRLGPAFQFLSEHRVFDSEGRLQGYRHLDKIREKLAPILLRRTRAQVLHQLPDRTDSTLYVEMVDAQRVPYEEQRTALARLLQKKILTELDRQRTLCCLANMRMLCDSTYLFDKTTNVSPKLEEFSELIQELGEEGGHKAVVFSQWEMMLEKAAERLDALNLGYAFLHGRVPVKDRRALLKRFADDPKCRVLLSTDTGGTGLNLQVADTVINLEIPWNPAILEQRIARVHRMGQSRPVRVILLVTRGSIEERVIKTVEMKRSLFAGVFEGETDDVNFDSPGGQQFLNSVRDLLGDTEPEGSAVPSGVGISPAEGPRQRLLLAGVQFLEALAELAESGREPIPAELAQRVAAAVARLLGPDSE